MANNTRLKHTFVSIGVGGLAVLTVFLATVAVYTVMYGNTYIYNLGYVMGYLVKYISSIF